MTRTILELAVQEDPFYTELDEIHNYTRTFYHRQLNQRYIPVKQEKSAYMIFWSK